MKLLKNVKVIVAVILALAAVGVWIGVRSHVPSSEIARTEMLQFLEKKLITRASVTPLIYQGIYNVDGSYIARPGAAPSAGYGLAGQASADGPFEFIRNDEDIERWQGLLSICSELIKME